MWSSWCHLTVLHICQILVWYWKTENHTTLNFADLESIHGKVSHLPDPVTHGFFLPKHPPAQNTLHFFLFPDSLHSSHWTLVYLIISCNFFNPFFSTLEYLCGIRVFACHHGDGRLADRREELSERELGFISQLVRFYDSTTSSKKLSAPDHPHLLLSGLPCQHFSLGVLCNGELTISGWTVFTKTGNRLQFYLHLY